MWAVGYKFMVLKVRSLVERGHANHFLSVNRENGKGKLILEVLLSDFGYMLLVSRHLRFTMTR